MKILNLYAGIGGNRKFWGDKHDITAVENNKKIAKMYSTLYPNDKMIIGDAHQYLLEHYKEFDFIWSSPPCPTHSRTNTFLNAQGVIRYPDMSLYQEIIFLKSWFKGKWVVENVIPYYDPLIKPQIVGRHSIWCNFHISDIKVPNDFHHFSNKGRSKRATGDKPIWEKNAVNSSVGLHIFNMAFKEKQKTL